MNSPKVIFNYKFQLAIKNPDNKHSKELSINRATEMFDYYSNPEKQAMNLFDYYTGDINKQEKMNLVLENGKYATKKDIDKRKKEYSKYIENSNLSKCVVSFNNDYVCSKIDIKKLEQLMVKNIIPMFLKKCGYIDINKMSYQLSLHTDTDNLHFHFSFIEKEPNYQYGRKKIGYKRTGKITESEINFLKNMVLHEIEKESLYTPLLKETNKELEELKRYFNPKEKSFLLKDKKDLILEENILRLGKLISLYRKDKVGRIKYNSINNQEIKDLTNSIKNYLFSKDNKFQTEYKDFKKSLKEINHYFEKLSKDNNIKDILLDSTFTDKKNEYLSNYVLNAIVNHANYLYKTKTKKMKITENDIIEEIIVKEYLNNKKRSRFNTLKNYLSNNTIKFQNKYKIEQAIKSINDEMEDAQKEFSKLFLPDDKSL